MPHNFALAATAVHATGLCHIRLLTNCIVAGAYNEHYKFIVMLLYLMEVVMERVLCRQKMDQPGIKDVQNLAMPTGFVFLFTNSLS